VYAAVQYPSLRELWPDVYYTEGVKTVQARLESFTASAKWIWEMFMSIRLKC